MSKGSKVILDSLRQLILSAEIQKRPGSAQTPLGAEGHSRLPPVGHSRLAPIVWVIRSLRYRGLDNRRTSARVRRKERASSAGLPHHKQFRTLRRPP